MATHRKILRDISGLVVPMRWMVWGMVAGVIGAVVGCSGPVVPKPSAISARFTASAAQGAGLYAGLCAACHGSTGHGDGPVAATLPMAPADLTRLAQAAGGAFPRDAAMAWIHGYPDRYSARVMPEFGPLLDGPRDLVLDAQGQAVATPRALIQIVDYLETLQRG